MYLIKKYINKVKLDYPNKIPTFFEIIKAWYINPSYHLALSYRFGCYLYESNFFLFKAWASKQRLKLILKRNCDISFTAKIGPKIKFPHPIGIVIGGGVIVGHNVTIFQNVTLGSHGKKDKLKEYPVISDNVIIYSGSIIIGGVTIGKDSIIGANTFINKDIPPNSKVYGNPFKIIKKTVDSIGE